MKIIFWRSDTMKTKKVWIMLHSGSKNVGSTMAKFYDNVAMCLLQKKGVKAYPSLN